MGNTTLDDRIDIFPRAWRSKTLFITVRIKSKKHLLVKCQKCYDGRIDLSVVCPSLPIPKIDFHLEVYKAVRQRGRHLIDHTSVIFPVSRCDDTPPLRQLILPYPSIQDELISRSLHSRRRRIDLIEEENALTLIIFTWKKTWLRPNSFSALLIKKWNPFEVRWIKQGEPQVDKFQIVLLCDLFDDG